RRGVGAPGGAATAVLRSALGAPWALFRSPNGRYHPATMNRRAFVTGLGAVLAAPLAAEAQQAGKVWRIGTLDYASDPKSSSRWTALRDRLRELGYVESQSAHIAAENGCRRSRRRFVRRPSLPRDSRRSGLGPP